MIVCENEATRFKTRFTDGVHTAHADAAPDKGGAGSGFNPHDLLEAALGTCIAITLEMYAVHHAIPLNGVKVTVELDRKDPAEPVFAYAIELKGDLDPGQRDRLLRAAKACPVHKTLSRPLAFRDRTEA